MFVEKLPERLPMPQLLCRAAAQRNHPAAKMKAMFRPFNLRCRKIKLKSLRIAMNEIKDSVSARIHSSDQVRPRHRTLRRNAGRQTTERSLLGQPRKVRHLALGHKLRKQVRIKPINAEDDHLLRRKRATMSALARRQEAQPRSA